MLRGASRFSTAAALAYQAKAAVAMPNQPPVSVSDVSGVERAEGQQREGHQDHCLQPRVADSLTLNTLSTSVVIAKPARPRGPGSAMPSGNDRTETLDIGHTPQAAAVPGYARRLPIGDRRGEGSRRLGVLECPVSRTLHPFPITRTMQAFSDLLK